MPLPAERPLSPHLQVYRPMYTMVLSILHRASGLYLSACGFLLVGWLVAELSILQRSQSIILASPGVNLLG